MSQELQSQRRFTLDSPRVVHHSEQAFANVEELIAHLSRFTGIAPISATSIRGGATSRGSYARRRTDDTHAHSTGDPILDSIISPMGELVIGGRGVTNGPSNPRAVSGEATLCKPGPDGLQECRSADGSTIVFREPGGAFVQFHAWRKSGFYWSIGTEITTWGRDFDEADIRSRYYDTAFGEVCAVMYDDDHDSNDDHVDEYEWGVNAPQPRQVQSLCRVIWNGHYLSGLVSAGEACYAPNVDPWPTGWPDVWPPPPPDAAISISPTALEFVTHLDHPRSTKQVRVSSSFQNDTVVTVSPARLDVHPRGELQPVNVNPFSNVSGQITVPGGGSVNLQVSFDGSVIGGGAVAVPAGSFSGRFTIQAENISRTVTLEGRVTQLVG